jgi:CYTH domain-containing protein
MRILVCATLCALLSAPLFAGVPDPVKSRFVVGDAVWREIPIRDDLMGQYDKCWQTAINAILESNFAIATMDKESGYVRTTENSGVVTLKGDWVYSVQVSIKFTYIPPAASGQQATVQKIRIQASGHLAKISKGRLKEAFQGYDSVVLQNVFQDLQAKLGPR